MMPKLGYIRNGLFVLTVVPLLCVNQHLTGWATETKTARVGGRKIQTDTDRLGGFINC